MHAKNMLELQKTSHTYAKVYIGKYYDEKLFFLLDEKWGHMKFAQLKIIQPWLSLLRVSLGFIAVFAPSAFYTESAEEA